MSSSSGEHEAPTLSSGSEFRNELGLAVAIVLVIGFTLIFNQSYIAKPWINARDILHQTALLGIFALGAGIVIISGGIDLSSGSVIVFSGSTCALTMMALAPLGADGTPDPSNVGAGAVVLAILVSIFAGFLIGTVHAWLITVVHLPPFVATLASLVGLRSLAKVLNIAVSKQLGAGDGQAKVRADDVTFELLSQWWVALVVFLLLVAAFWIMMNRTIVGRHLYAMGGNEEAARLSGIRTDRLKWLAYCIGAMTASIAGVFYVAKIGAANPDTLAVGYELNAIAAAVVGGCSLQGGIGLIPGVVLGVVFLRVVIDAVGRIVRSRSTDYEGLIVGFLVVLAVAFNELRREGSGGGKEFFPGALGLVTIPILAGLVGTVAFVMGNLQNGLITGGIVLVLLVALKISESIRASNRRAIQ